MPASLSRFSAARTGPPAHREPFRQCHFAKTRARGEAACKDVFPQFVSQSLGGKAARFIHYC